ncbi:uncharacterized protein TNCV_4432421 [Trichonephila clavipes]|nr:uncharacterized protein TNCV_4432421 [Trichonephila clavipes]
MQKTGFQMLNDDEIVASVQEESNPVDDETDEDEGINNESSKDPSNADTFSAVETAMEWYEQQSECCLTQLLLLKRIRSCSEKTKTNPEVPEPAKNDHPHDRQVPKMIAKNDAYLALSPSSH